MSSEGQPRGAGQLRRAAAAEEDSGGVGASGGAGAGSATAGAAKMRTGSNEEAMMLINLIGQLSKSESQSEREQQKQEMQRELDLHDMQVAKIVDKHQNSFFSALHAFIETVMEIDNARDRAAAVHRALETCKELLILQRENVRRLWIECIEQKQTLRILDRIDAMRKVPEQVRKYMKSKHFVTAAWLIVDTLRSLEEFKDVPALRELKRVITKQREEVQTKLIDELERQLFLRDPQTRDRLSTLEPFLISLGSPDHVDPKEDPAKDPKENVAHYFSFMVEACFILGRLHDALDGINRQLHAELELLTSKAIAYCQTEIIPRLPTDLTFRPSATGHHSSVDFTAEDSPYVHEELAPHVLFHVVARLLEQLMKVLQAHLVVQGCVKRFNGKHAAFIMEEEALSPGSTAAAEAADSTLPLTENPAHAELLGGSTDEEAHKVERHRRRDPAEIYTAKDLWLAVQSELVSLLCSYLDIGDEGHAAVLTAVAMNTPPSAAAIMTTSSGPATFHADDVLAQFGKPGKEKDKKKPTLFAFANSANAIVDSRAYVERTLRSTETGTKHLDRQASDRYTAEAAGTTKALCARTVRNIYGVYKPCLLFLQHVERLLPNQAAGSGLQLFIDYFVGHRFMAYLQDKVRAELKEMTEEMSYTSESLHDAAEGVVVLQSAVRMQAIINKLCAVIYDVPHCAQDIVKVLHNALSRYLEYCQNRFKTLCQTAKPNKTCVRKGNFTVSSEWITLETLRMELQTTKAWKAVNHGAHRSESHSTAPTASSTTGNAEDWVFVEDSVISPPPEEAAVQQAPETETLLHLLGDRMLDKADIMGEMTSVKSMCHLLESLEWLANKLSDLADTLSADANGLSRFWQTEDMPIIFSDNDMAAAILSSTLTREGVAPLRDIATKLHNLATTCLMLLRIEVRAQCLYYLVPTLRLVSYYCDAESVEADSRVIALNKVLTSFDEVLSTCLSKTKRKFILESLGSFLADVLIYGMQWIKQYNNNGVRRMSRNIFALQQTHQSIDKTRTPALDRAESYYSLLYLEPADILESIGTQGPQHSEEEYRVVLSLIAASALNPGTKEHADALKMLHDMFHKMV